jgi:hypothetical protein
MTNLWAAAFTPEERLLAEQAVLQYRALREACVAAPHGKVLAIAERLAVDQGREAMRRQLETALQQEAAEAEKKGAQAAAARAVTCSARTADASGAKSSRRRAR